jgi:hypothetical protein
MMQRTGNSFFSGTNKQT